MFPVFSLVLDQDVKPEMALLYPELYKDLTKVPSKAPISISNKGGVKTRSRRMFFSSLLLRDARYRSKPSSSGF